MTDALEETTLADDGEALLYITGFSHGSDEAVVMDIKDTVGLVDGAKHGLDNHRGRRVGDEARLLMKLTSEEVDTEVAVLAGLRGDRDTDDLARTSLENEEITDTNEVNGDGDAVLARDAATRLNDTNLLADTSRVVDNHFFPLVRERMKETVGSTLNAAAERVVVTFVVVVAHLGLGCFFTDSLLGNGDLSGTGVRVRSLRSYVVSVSTVSCSLRLVAAVVSHVNLVSRLNAAAEVAFSNVKLGLVGPVLNGSSGGGRSRMLLVTTNRFAETFTGEFYLRVVWLSAVVNSVTLLVNASFLEARVRTAVVGTDAYVNFFLSVDTGVGKRSTSSIFPSDARSAIDFNLSFYSRLSSLRDSVTPVRRREDTEGDGYTGFKVQIDCPLSVLSRMPFELLKTTRKARQEKT